MVAVTKRYLTRFEAWDRLTSRFASHIPPVESGPTLTWGRKYLPHYYEYEPSTLHKWLEAHLDYDFEKRGKRAVVVGPRRGAKSTISTLTYPLKKAVEGSEPYILLLADTDSQAVQNLANIKMELESNEHGLLDDYPNACGKGPIWQDGFIKLRNGVVIQAAGTGAAIRGRRIRHKRPTLIIGDDLENDSHITSKAERHRVKTWFNRTVMNMGDSSTNVIVLGTALHREALLMELMRRPGWIVRREHGRPAPFRAIEVWPAEMKLWEEWESIFNKPDDPKAEKKAKRFFKRHRGAMLRGARLCWPEMEPLYELMTLRAEIGHSAFEAEKQGNPIDPSTCEWPERYFTYPEFYFDEWPADLIIKGMALDPSKGKADKRHDYSSIAYGGISRDGIVYVDCSIDKRPVNDIVSETLALYQDFRPDSLAVETNQFQELLAHLINETAEDYGISCHCTEFENFTSKIVRIRRLSSLLAQKRIRFRAGSEGANLCIQQMRDFPNGDHDDGPDSVEMLCRLMFDKLGDSDEDQLQDQMKRVMESFQ